MLLGTAQATTGLLGVVGDATQRTWEEPSQENNSLSRLLLRVNCANWKEYIHSLIHSYACIIEDQSPSILDLERNVLSPQLYYAP